MQMKKFAFLLILCVFLCQTCAFALNGANYPAWNGADPASNSFCASLDGQMLQLEFDPTDPFSMQTDGMLQLCFFAYDGAEQNYLELYLLLPASLSTGDLFSSDVAAQANSITLYEVSQTGEDMYFAGQFVGVAYPDNSCYEIRIDQADRSADTLSLRGTLSATLCYFDASGQPTSQTLSLSDAQFHLELPIDSAVVAATPQPSAAPESSEAPLPDLPSSTPDVATPRPTLDPHPVFTLPPDYRIV